MTKSISEGQFTRLSALIAAKMGLHFPAERRRYLENQFIDAARELGFKDSKSCIEWLTASPLTKSRIEVLAGHLTVGETFFFRDKRLFQALEKSILPTLIHSRRNNGKYLRIWSAGCATGEEAYSIAILLTKLVPDIRDWNITVLATDINTRSLQVAARGVYGQWSFRDMPPGCRGSFFVPAGDGRFEVIPLVREMVTFSYLNLVEDIYPLLANNTNAMDLIFCRNVLMYFTQDHVEKVAQNLFRCLVDGGCLIVSPSELSNLLLSHFSMGRSSGGVLYRRDGQSPHAASAFVSGPPEITAVLPEPGMEYAPGPFETPGPAEPQATPPTETGEEQSLARRGADLYPEALALYEKGLYMEAARKVEALLDRDPLEPRTMALLARIHANMGKLVEALEWCKKTIAAEKLNPDHYYLMATVLVELGRTESAAVSLKHALYLDPGMVAAYLTLGTISRGKDGNNESAKYFRNALSLLASKRPEEVLPGFEGVTAGRLTEIIERMQQADIER